MEKALPYSKEAEQAVLGSAIYSIEAARTATTELTSDMFYINDHRDIFEAIKDILQEGGNPDNVTVADRLQNNAHIEPRPWATLISELWNNLPYVPNLAPYIKSVKNKYVLRQAAIVGMEITRRAMEEKDSEAVIDTIRKSTMELLNNSTSVQVEGFDDVLRRSFDTLELHAENKGSIMGVATGYAKMDEMLVGLQKGDLIIIAARPSVGKTAMALNIAANVAIRQKLPVLVCSIEMSAEQLGQRIISSEALVNGQNLRTGDLNEDDWERVAIAVQAMKGAPLYIDEKATTVTDIRSSAMRVKNEKGLSLVVIDYLQLITSRGKSESRQQEVAEITRGLKALARELKVPVICLAQVSRLVEQSEDRVPKLSHLKESGEIEQAADVVMFIHKETDGKKLEDDPSLRGKVQLIVAKQRNGPVGNFEMGWRGEFVKYMDIE